MLNEDAGTLSGDALSKLTFEGDAIGGGDQATINSNLFTPATVKSLQSIKSSEKLYEVITLVATEAAELHELKSQISSTPNNLALSFQRRPLLHAYALGLDSTSTMDFGPKMLLGAKVLLGMVQRIPAADLEQAVLMLPLPTLVSLIKIIDEWFAVEEDTLTSFGAALLGFCSFFTSTRFKIALFGLSTPRSTACSL